jgi:predicted HTH transcriptional regulator
LQVGSLLYGVPIYRNLLLADAVRFCGLSDKIGRGIDIVFKTVVAGGFDFPYFESANNFFRASISLSRSEDFREFVRRRGASLSQLDELIVLRYLWERREGNFKQLSDALQRGKEVARRILHSMESKLMIEMREGLFQLTASVRSDIEHSFNADQLDLDLFGAA